MTTTPGIYDLIIYQGATFGRTLTWKDESDAPVDLTGYNARLQMRESHDASAPFITLTTENGGIALGDEDGTITLSVSATATAALSAEGGVYDLELVSGSGVVSRLLEGSVLISKEVTR